MKRLIVLAVAAVVLVVVAGGLVFSLSGPHPLATKVVNFEPRVATSEIDRCAQGNGEIHISGTTTATQSSYPTVSVFGFSGSRYFADQTIHLSRLDLNQSSSWHANIPEHESASGCEVVTLVFAIPPQGSLMDSSGRNFPRGW
jgi:hypothetical protein